MSFQQLLQEHLTQTRFAFALRGWKEPPGEFFRATPEREVILAERRRWFEEEPKRYLFHTPLAVNLIAEACGLACQFDPALTPPEGAAPEKQLRWLGEHWEPDILLCCKKADGQISMEAGAICFPSHWAPETKIGLPIEALHAPVPGLNAAIGMPIFNLLDRLPAGYAWLRLNWGLSASPERNQHPSRGLPRLSASTPMEAIWLRVEHQALLRLPVSSGILFGIRVQSLPLPSLRGMPGVARAVAGQLRNMPLEMQSYKGIQEMAGRVAEWLDQDLAGAG